jgi:hypothetical protein
MVCKWPMLRAFVINVILVLPVTTTQRRLVRSEREKGVGHEGAYPASHGFRGGEIREK